MEEDPAAYVLAGGAMSKLTSKLDGLQSTEGRRLMPIPWEVKNVLIPLIKQNMESIMAIIRDEQDNNNNSSRAVIRCLTKELRELSYDIHDCADEYATGPASDRASRLLARMVRHMRVATKKKTSCSSSSSSSSSLSTARACRRRADSRPVTIWLSKRLKGRLWLLDKMRGFSSRSEEALRRYNSFNRPLKKQRNDKDDGGGGPSSSSGESFGSWSPPPYSQVMHRRVVIHDPAIMISLEAWLKDGDQPELKVASMVGCGGVGKTTLASDLYSGIGRQFECRAFVRASQKPDLRRFLMSMLSQVRPHQPPHNWKVHNLIEEIRTHLQDKR